LSVSPQTVNIQPHSYEPNPKSLPRGDWVKKGSPLLEGCPMRENTISKGGREGLLAQHVINRVIAQKGP